MTEIGTTSAAIRKACERAMARAELQIELSYIPAPKAAMRSLLGVALTHNDGRRGISLAERPSGDTLPVIVIGTAGQVQHWGPRDIAINEFMRALGIANPAATRKDPEDVTE
jgi:hypothetical protein